MDPTRTTTFWIVHRAIFPICPWALLYARVEIRARPAQSDGPEPNLAQGIVSATAEGPSAALLSRISFKRTRPYDLERPAAL